jgi:hypothetical protein
MMWERQSASTSFARRKSLPHGGLPVRLLLQPLPRRLVGRGRFSISDFSPTDHGMDQNKIPTTTNIAVSAADV